MAYARRCGRTQLFRLQPSVNLHGQLQPSCSAALVPNVLPRSVLMLAATPFFLMKAGRITHRVLLALPCPLLEHTMSGFKADFIAKCLSWHQPFLPVTPGEHDGGHSNPLVWRVLAYNTIQIFCYRAIFCHDDNSSVHLQSINQSRQFIRAS